MYNPHYAIYITQSTLAPIDMAMWLSYAMNPIGGLIWGYLEF